MEFSQTLSLHIEQSALMSKPCHVSTVALLSQLLCHALQLHRTNMTTLPVIEAYYDTCLVLCVFSSLHCFLQLVHPKTANIFIDLKKNTALVYHSILHQHVELLLHFRF